MASSSTSTSTPTSGAEASNTAGVSTEETLGESTGTEQPGEPDAFFPLARSGERLEMRGVSFEGVPLVLEVFDRELQTPCTLREVAGTMICAPTAAGLLQYQSVEQGPRSFFFARPRTARDCGPAYWPAPDASGSEPLVRLTPAAVADDVVLTDGLTEVLAASLEVFELSGGETIATGELVSGEVTTEVDALGHGVRVWTGEDGSRLVVGLHDARFGTMEFVDDMRAPWLVPVLTPTVDTFVDAACSERVVCAGEGQAPLVARTVDDDYYLGGEPSDDAAYFGSPESCGMLDPPVESCFEAIGPIDPASEFPLVEQLIVSYGDVEARLLAYAGGPRVAMLDVRDAAGEPCTPRRVGETLRCLPPLDPAITAAQAPSSLYRDPSCTESVRRNLPGHYAGVPFYRHSLGLCDDGGSIFEWLDTVEDPSFYLDTAEGCIPRSFPMVGSFHVYVEGDDETYPAMSPVEVF